VQLNILNIHDTLFSGCIYSE